MGRKRPFFLNILKGSGSQASQNVSENLPSTLDTSLDKRSRSGDAENESARDEDASEFIVQYRTRSVVDQEVDGSSQQQNTEPIPDLMPEQSTQSKGSSQQLQRKRGPTRMRWIWSMPTGDTIEVPVNASGTPHTQTSAVLANFLGTIARDGRFAPISIARWDDVAMRPYINEMMRAVKAKFTISDTADWIKKNLNRRWRDWKSELKGIYYDPALTKEQIMEKVPPRVMREQLLIFVSSWYTAEYQEMSVKNTVNATKKPNVHTGGRKSYSRISEELEKSSGMPPDRLTIYDVTHKRKDGSYVNEESRNIMERARALQEKHQEAYEDGSSQHVNSAVNEQIFQELMGPKHSGRDTRRGIMSDSITILCSRSYRVQGSNSRNETEDLKKQLNEMKTKNSDMRREMEDMRQGYDDMRRQMEDMKRMMT